MLRVLIWFTGLLCGLRVAFIIKYVVSLNLPFSHVCGSVGIIGSSRNRALSSGLVWTPSTRLANRAGYGFVWPVGWWYRGGYRLQLGRLFNSADKRLPTRPNWELVRQGRQLVPTCSFRTRLRRVGFLKKTWSVVQFYTAPSVNLCYN